MKNVIEKALRLGGDQAELFVVQSDDLSVIYENGALKRVERSEREGGALRVLQNGRLGFATTTNFESADLWAEQAVAAAKYGTPFAFDFVKPSTIEGLKPFDPRIKSFTEEQMLNIGSQALSHLKQYDPNIISSCTISKSIQTISLITSSGFEQSYDKTLFSFVLSGQLIEKQNFLESYDGIEQTQLEFDLGSYLTSVIEPFRHGRKNVSIKSGAYPVILTPRALSGLLLALEMGLSGKNVAKSISPLKEKLGRKILDERITLFADGTLKGGALFAPFDDEGTPSQKNMLFQRGELKNYLLDLRTAEELNMYPTGNGLRTGRLFQSKDYQQLPRPAVNSWVLEGGERQFDEIFLETKQAVLIDQVMGLLMSTQVNGDFAGNIALGYLIEEGEIKGRVKDCMLAGNIYDLLSEKHLQEITQDQRWILGMHGGTHLLPTLFLKEISLSAK